MFTAYLYRTENIESACKQFLNEKFQQTYIIDVLDTLNCTEFVQDGLLRKEYLDGEILEDNGQVAILTKNSIDGFDINKVNSSIKCYPAPEEIAEK